MVDWLIGWRQKQEKVCVSAKKPPILYANHFLNKNIFANLLINVVFFCAIITFKKILLKKNFTVKNAFRAFEKYKKKKIH